MKQIQIDCFGWTADAAVKARDPWGGVGNLGRPRLQKRQNEVYDSVLVPLVPVLLRTLSI